MSKHPSSVCTLSLRLDLFRFGCQNPRCCQGVTLACFCFFLQPVCPISFCAPRRRFDAITPEPTLTFSRARCISTAPLACLLWTAAVVVVAETSFPLSPSRPYSGLNLRRAHHRSRYPPTTPQSDPHVRPPEIKIVVFYELLSASQLTDID